MNFLGLDLSLTGTGVCEYDTHTHFCSTIKTKLKGQLRKHHIGDIIYERLKYTDFCAIEGYSYASKGRAVFDIAELGGLIRDYAWQQEVATIIVPPTTLKKFTTSRGNASKDEMMLQVFKKWGFEAKDNNQADAYALARFAECYFTNTTNHKYEAECMEKVQRLK